MYSVKDVTWKKGITCPELLSPAGDMDCLKAAISAGCDAVYAGSDRFGARAYAGNFSPEEFIHAIDRVHLFGKKIFLTLNTLIKPEEFDEIYGFVKPFYEAGLDGVIVQDMGVMSLLLKEFKEMRVHASTQMSISSVYGARMLQNLGVSRIVLSRELSLNEISEIQKGAEVELECFIHGAMCYSYSGLCLMSSFLGGRSGNRGRCAGPCRQPYSVAKLKDKYLLSMKDLCVIDILDELIYAGIDSFKIEGRMKSPAYVYGVTDIYRRNIDRILDDPNKNYMPSDTDRERLTDLYSRGGISDGYYHRNNGLSMITLEKGSYKREDKSRETVKPAKLPLIARLSVNVGEPVYLEVSSTANRDISIAIEGDAAGEALKHPMSEADFMKQINKTGDTDFYFEDIKIKTDGKSFVPVSALNSLRRKAIDMIKDRLTNDHKRSM